MVRKKKETKKHNFQEKQKIGKMKKNEKKNIQKKGEKRKDASKAMILPETAQNNCFFVQEMF